MTTKTGEKTKKRAKRVAALSRVGRGSDQFIVRLPEGMREYLSEVAERSGRSMNAEIVAALAVHFANEGVPLNDRVKNEIIDMQKAIEDLTKEVSALRKDKGEKA
jgi:hypothetical protein